MKNDFFEPSVTFDENEFRLKGMSRRGQSGEDFGGCKRVAVVLIWLGSFSLALALAHAV